MSGTDRHPVLIVGAGLGGSALGVALAQRGVPFQILERTPVATAPPVGLMLAGNGFEALRALGVAEQAQAAGQELRQARFCQPGGDDLLEVPLGTFSERYGSRVLAMPARALLASLQSALPEGSIQWGSDVREVALHDDHAAVTLAVGRVVEGSVLVGADGAASHVRGLIGVGPEASPFGLVCYRGMVDGSVERPDALEVWIHRNTQYGLMPLRDGRLYWWVMLRAEPGMPGWRLRQPAQVARLIPDQDAEVIDAISRTRASAMRRVVPVVRAPGRDWGRGPATLIGDAAHVMAPRRGQGGSQAIIDGVVLGGLLAERGCGPQTLRAYEAHRSREVRWYVMQSRRSLEAMLIDDVEPSSITSRLSRLLPVEEEDREGRLLHSMRR